MAIAVAPSNSQHFCCSKSSVCSVEPQNAENWEGKKKKFSDEPKCKNSPATDLHSSQLSPGFVGLELVSDQLWTYNHIFLSECRLWLCVCSPLWIKGQIAIWILLFLLFNSASPELRLRGNPLTRRVWRKTFVFFYISDVTELWLA